MPAKKKKTSKASVSSLLEEKLKSSGLTLSDAKTLKMEGLSAQQTSTLHSSFQSRVSLKLNYYGPDGKPLSDWFNCPDFYRLRYLEKGTEFADNTENKEVRYVQEPYTVPVAYYPQNVKNWSGLLKDTSKPLCITEGELKAAKASKEGFPTIGLGGVYNFRSLSLGVEWLPSLEGIDWVRRSVYICYDSDYLTNPNVCKAMMLLSEELENRGAFVSAVLLPEIPEIGDKTGLDDYFVFSGTYAHEKFTELLTDSEPLGLSKPLWKFNDKYVYVQDPGLIADTTNLKARIKPSSFKEHKEAAASYQERSLRNDGTVSYDPVPAAQKWLTWPLRREVSKITYEPGQEMFVNEPLELNTWKGWGCKPKKGSVKLFLRLIDHLFSGAEPEAKKWFIQWCAYPLQHPGEKIYSSPVLHGIVHGTGKSLLGYTLGEIYGENFTEISQRELESGYTEWAENKQLVMGDDVTGSNKREHAEVLKRLITQKSMRVNIKYIPSYTIPDCTNYIFTANHPDAFFLEDNDRRFFIHEIVVGPLDEQFYADYDEWLTNGDGAANVFHYLLNYDTSDFNHKAAAEFTAAKARMINTGRSDLASWVRQILLTPDTSLRLGDVKVEKDLLTSKELLLIYDPDGRTTANGIARELSRAGVRQACDGKPLKLKDGTQSRYFVIRNQEKWIGVKPPAVIKYLNSFLPDDKSASKKKY